MKRARISAALRREVRERARERCEYCLLAESEAYGPHEPDHLIALKHGGETSSANLVLACFDCNRFKGSDISSLDPITGELVPLFIPLTPVGRATERLLKLNLATRLKSREQSAKLGLYP